MQEVSDERSHFDGAPMTTLVEAKAELRAALLAGGIVDCPCCTQVCKIYKRKLNKPMARLLLWLVHQPEKDPRWYNVHEFPLIQGRRGGGDFAKLVHWGLVEECPKDSEDKTRRTSGLWRPTKKGIAFARGEVEVLSHVHLYNNVAYDVGHAQWIGIRDALGNKFDYEELMGEGI